MLYGLGEDSVAIIYLNEMFSLKTLMVLVQALNALLYRPEAAKKFDQKWKSLLSVP
ncbi:hypothetical protein [Flagellimonas meridianipacifica]|uniref:hypothetical protein n=1 Tax=Flagellimonas meridianipacifica TaxID=1080225 RepID=UPI001304F1B4|nr:hypothetical protein [Allomuricauda pacifica]